MAIINGNGESRKVQEFLVFYIPCFRREFWNLVESLERILAMYMKRWWNFEILSGTGDPREVHQILEIQRNMEDFEDCKDV